MKSHKLVPGTGKQKNSSQNINRIKSYQNIGITTAKLKYGAFILLYSKVHKKSSQNYTHQSSTHNLLGNTEENQKVLKEIYGNQKYS